MKRALLLGGPSIININVINSLFSLLESRFRFDTLDFQCLDSRSTKFQDLQLPHEPYCLLRTPRMAGTIKPGGVDNERKTI